MFSVFTIFFATFYTLGKDKTSTVFFILFTVILIITFVSYRSNYRSVPTRKMLRKYKYDKELLIEERREGGKLALGIILFYLPVNIVTLLISLLLIYI